MTYLYGPTKPLSQDQIEFIANTLSTDNRWEQWYTGDTVSRLIHTIVWKDNEIKKLKQQIEDMVDNFNDNFSPRG